MKDQHKSSLSVAYAAKYARIWLEKVRERKAERAMDAERLKDALWSTHNNHYWLKLLTTFYKLNLTNLTNVIEQIKQF